MMEMLCGSAMGLMAGAAAALWWLPRGSKPLWQRARDAAQEASSAIKETAQAAAPRDPIAESLAQGKAAARRRMDELGLKNGR